MSSHQIITVSLDQLVSPSHQYRKFKSLFNFRVIEAHLHVVEADNNYKGFGVLRLFKCLTNYNSWKICLAESLSAIYLIVTLQSGSVILFC
jgi:hypothetical protein